LKPIAHTEANTWRSLPAITAVLILTFGFAAVLNVASARANESVWSCGITDTSGANNIWVATSAPGLAAQNACSSGAGLEVQAPGNQAVGQGKVAQWEATAPTGLVIVLVYVPPNDLTSNSLNDGDSSYGGGFFWDGGYQNVSDPNSRTGFGAAGLSTKHVGFYIVCSANPCAANPIFDTASLEVTDIGLQVAETRSPTLATTSGILTSSNWIRGTWPLSFTADSPSGVCILSADVDGAQIAEKSFPKYDTIWHQCDALGQGGVNQPLDTSTFTDGPETIAVHAIDAAGQTASNSKLLMLDNTAPSVSVSGPTDALSTAGTQEISVIGHAGLSGVSAVGCSVDGSPVTWTSVPATTIPVAGIGSHQIICYAANNARDASGAVAISQPVGWTLSIRQPSVSTVSFAHVVDALQCKRTRERVRIPARWVTGRAHGKPVRVRVPAQTRSATVVHCRPRFVRKRVRVGSRTYTERVIVLPHQVRRNSLNVRYGAATSVSGWLGTDQGNAVAGQTVRILTAADDGRGQFEPASAATTAADGSWTAILPAGPSRLVRVAFGGSATVEPALSNIAHVRVRAPVQLSVSPRVTHWGSTIKLTGHLVGGHVPPAGELLVLRIGWAGGTAEIGHLYSNRDGGFKISYTFLRGNGTERYRIWAQTVRESDYPYAVGTSRPVRVRVDP
jgi:hypothetical protein